MLPTLQVFHVGIKAVIVDDRGRLLMLRERDAPCHWELPGGRIDVGEEHLSYVDVLRRELREELGLAFRCRIGAPLLSWVRPPRAPEVPHTFLLGISCDEASGPVQLSAEHCEHRWVGAEQWQDLPLAPGYAAALAGFWRTSRG